MKKFEDEISIEIRKGYTILLSEGKIANESSTRDESFIKVLGLFEEMFRELIHDAITRGAQDDGTIARSLRKRVMFMGGGNSEMIAEPTHQLSTKHLSEPIYHFLDDDSFSGHTNRSDTPFYPNSFKKKSRGRKYPKNHYQRARKY